MLAGAAPPSPSRVPARARVCAVAAVAHPAAEAVAPLQVDPDGGSCNHLVAPGDELLEVDGTRVRSANIASIESLIFGALGSVVRLVLSSHGRLYEIHVKRHGTRARAGTPTHT